MSAGSARTPMTELSGELDRAGLPAILRFLSGLNKTGCLHIVHGDWQGEVFFESGRVVGARLGSRHGLTALDALVQVMPGASFNFDVLSRAQADADIALTTDGLQAHLDDLLHRMASGAVQLPSLDSVPEVLAQADPATGGDPLPLDRLTLLTLVAVDGVRTVRDIVALRGSIDALWHLGTLVEVGLIRVPAPVVGSPASEEASPVGSDAQAASFVTETPGDAPVRRPVVLEPQVEVGHCPKLGFEDDPKNSFGRPTRLHRCFAAGTPLPLSIDQQRELCLSDQFGTCPRLNVAPAGRAGAQPPRPASAPRPSPTEAESDGRIVRLPFGGRGAAPRGGPLRGGPSDRQAVGASEVTPLHHPEPASRDDGSPRPTPLRARADRERERTHGTPAGAETPGFSGEASAPGQGAQGGASGTAAASAGRAGSAGAAASSGSVAAGADASADYGRSGQAGGAEAASGFGGSGRAGGADATRGFGGSGRVGGADASADFGRSGRAEGGAGAARVRGAPRLSGEAAATKSEPRVSAQDSLRRALVDDSSGGRLWGIPIAVIAGLGVVVSVVAVIAYLLFPYLNDVFSDDSPDPSLLPNTSAVAAGAPVDRVLTPQVPPAARATPGPGAAAGPNPSANTSAVPAAASPVASTQPPRSATAPIAPANGALLNETFANNALNWPSSPQGNAWVATDGYRLIPRQAKQFVSIAAPLVDVPADVLATATFRKLAGPPGGGYGIILRDQSDVPLDGTNQGGHFYVLEVGDKGEIGIWRRDVDHWVDLLPWQHSDAVRTDTAANEVTVSAIGDRLSLSVNGTEVATRTDATLPAGGVGLFVGGDDNQVVVEHFSVRSP